MADPPLTLKECFRTRLKMDDENYRNVLNWYKSCIKLGETKSGRQKDAYTMRLIQNLLRTSSEFFGQTRLSHETVTKIENECAKMVDIILYPSDLPRKNEVTTRCPGRCPEVGTYYNFLFCFFYFFFYRLFSFETTRFGMALTPLDPFNIEYSQR